MITIYGIGEYTGSKEESSTIAKKRLSAVDFTISTANVKYTGKSIKKKIYSNLRERRDYKASYRNSENPEKAAITGQGNYTGKITKTLYHKTCEGDSIESKQSERQKGKSYMEKAKWCDRI